MAKYLQRSCPKCNGYLGIVADPVQAINGRCLKCGYRLAWVVDSRETSAERAVRRLSGLIRGVEKIYGPSNLGQ